MQTLILLVTFLLILVKYVPIKAKILRASHVPYMTRIVRKAIMKGTELENKYLQNKVDINLKAYKKKSNFCSKRYKKERKKYYNKLHINSIADSKELWITIKPFLSDKVPAKTKISLVKKGKKRKHLPNETKVLAKIF